MTSPKEENCHLCECPAHAKEFKTRKFHIRREVESNNVDSLRTLLDSSTWYKNNKKCSTSLSQTAILQSCCEVHQVTNSRPDFLHLACNKLNFETIHFLVEKGFDVNKQDFKMYYGYRETSLHKCCGPGISDEVDRGKVVEVVSMLLWYGADPMIEKLHGLTAFDKFILHYDPIMVTAQENLFLYTFDRYSKCIDTESFLIALNRLDVRIFDEITNKGSTPKIEFVDKANYTNNTCILHLFTMNSNRLQFLVENFDYVVKELFMSSDLIDFYSVLETPNLIENFEIIWKSKLKEEFTDWLCNVSLGPILYMTDASSAEKIVCLLLSYGATLYDFDLRWLYEEYGHCELFQILLHMDVELATHCYEENNIMPRILCDISLDVPKMIGERIFSKAHLRQLSPYFTIPSDLLLESGWKDVQNEPRVPLLVELARDVFRKYLIERFAVKNARQFYTHVKLLPISRHHQAIITLEAKLYY